MDFSAAPLNERQKIQTLADSLSRKVIGRPTRIELYQEREVIQADIIKKFDDGVIKYFLVKPDETIKVSYMQSLWEKELYKWTAWGSRELNIEP